MRACATLGIRLVHSRPGRPEGRGKIERVFRTVRDQFLVEAGHGSIEDVVRLNQLFAAWVETVYHRAVHSETNMTPLDRFGAGTPRYPSAAALHEAFLWSEARTVTKTATVSLFSNSYEVDPALVGRKVELVFDPFDLTKIEVRYGGRAMGAAVPVVIGRHSHPAARPEPGAEEPPSSTGIDYLHLVETRATAELGKRISYAGIGPEGIGVEPGAGWPSLGQPGLDDKWGHSTVSIQKLRSHWGFSRTPFGKDLAPSMLHRHPGHAEAVARISWCVEEAAIGVVTGEVGAGKTVAVRAALGDLDSSRHSVIYLGNPAIGARGLYTTIVSHLGQVPRFHRCSLIPQAQEALAAEVVERGRKVVLVVDEAHLLAADQLEELRLLTNADMDSASPFTLVLVGQPTLRQRLRLGAFAALDQRVALRYALPPLSQPDTADYIAHHLKLAGRADTLFSDDAVARVHQASRGLPRAVNNLALQALVAAYAAGASIVDDKAARAAVAEVTAE
jgi:type II secretory pathway predicted ATPase ExeA